MDTNVERLRDRDLAWADVVLLSGMHIQHDVACRPSWSVAVRAGCATVVGGPITSSVAAAELEGRPRGDRRSGRPDRRAGPRSRSREPPSPSTRPPSGRRWTTSPLPDLSLIKMRRYSTMTVQYSRGCPFNCEFCDIIEIYGGARAPRRWPRCWPNWTNCARPAGAKRCSSSTTTSSATRRAPRNCCRRWSNGAAATRRPSTSPPKLR